MNIERILAQVPHYQAFYTVDELSAEADRLVGLYPGAVKRLEVGKSTKGEPLWALRLGTGEKHALCYACPHPNEPIGAMTLITLAGILAADPGLLAQTGMTWTLIPCIDPDGTRLNEGWFKGPFSVEHYVRGFFRPAGQHQAEWTFPLDYKGHTWSAPIPETQALMAQIDALRPAFVFSLHNCAFGGAYWYLNQTPPGLCEKLEQTALGQGIPLHLGEPEAAYIAKHSKAVHAMMSMRDYYDWMEARGEAVPPGPMRCGTCGADYIATVCKSLVLMAELPYFLVAGIDDDAPADMTRRQALSQRETRRCESYGRLGALWGQVRPLIGAQNPFPHMVDSAVGIYARGRENSFSGPEFERRATRAEALDCLYISRIFEALDIGLALRSCQYELAQPGLSAAARQMLEQAAGQLDSWISQQCGQLEAGCAYRVADIGQLVRVQLESALHAIAYC